MTVPSFFEGTRMPKKSTKGGDSAVEISSAPSRLGREGGVCGDFSLEELVRNQAQRIEQVFVLHNNTSLACSLA